MAYAPWIEKAYKGQTLPKEVSKQEVHGIITRAPATTKPNTEIKAAKKEACIYTIKNGDTLTSIARRANDTIGGIAKRNNIKNINIIRIGQMIALKMDSAPSSGMAMSKASSEKFSSHTRASQKKPLTKKSLTKRKHHISHHAQERRAHVSSPSNENCALIGAHIRSVEDRLIARAECIRNHYGEFIKDAVASLGNKISHNEIIAIMIYESKGSPRAVSTARIPCLGLMQLQPGTAKEYGVRDIFDPRENIFGGARVFADYTYRHGGGDKSFGLAAYNMGPYNRTLHKVGFNPQRLKYVRDVEQILHTLESRQFTL